MYLIESEKKYRQVLKQNLHICKSRIIYLDSEGQILFFGGFLYFSRLEQGNVSMQITCFLYYLWHKSLIFVAKVCEKVASDLKLGGGFHHILPFSWLFTLMHLIFLLDIM